MVKTVIFYIIAILSIVSAIAAVNTKKLLRAAVYLATLLVLSAGLYLILSYEFLASIQVLVYVGGIVVLIAFAVMLVSSNDMMEDSPTNKRRLLAAIASILFLIVGFCAFFLTSFPFIETYPTHAGSAADIGRKLLDYGAEGFILPFEIISLLLLAAAIGGIVIARKFPLDSERKES